MNRFLLSLVLGGSCMMASASTTWTLQNKTYSVDTLYHAKIGPGTTRTALKLGGAQNLRVHYITTDITNEYVDMRVTKGKNQRVGVATLSSMSNEHSREGAQYFAGVNADFFANSAPCGPCVVDGKVICVMNNAFTSWYMNDKKQTGVGSLGFGGSVSAGGKSHVINGMNTYRDADQIIIYTRDQGATTGANKYGAEVAVMPVSGQLSYNGKMTVKVVGSPQTAGDMAIPEGGYVLSGHGAGSEGSGKEFIMSLSDGQEVEVETHTALNIGGEIVQMASGCPIILQDGKTLDTQGALDHLTALNPRTAVGYNADRTKVVLLVVDGRSSTSAGVVSRVLADIMREVGCVDAMNFDGGGSSELYTRTFGVINNPSDGHERAVTNAVWAVATGPTDNNIAEIQFMNHRMELPKYGYYKPVIYGYNKYGALISTNVEGFTLTCDDALGQVVEQGSTLFADGSGSHLLKATYGGAEATLVVSIGDAQPRMRLDKVIVDSYRDYKAEVVAEVAGTDMAIENSAMTWSSDNTDIATVDDNGLIKGVSEGVANVSGSINDLSVTLPVSVEIPQSRYIPVGKCQGIDDWTLSGSSTKNRSLEAVGKTGVAVNYTVSSTRNISVTLKQVTDLKALPDSMRLVINPGTYTVSSVIVSAGRSGERATQMTYTPQLKASTDNVVLIPVSDYIDTNDMINYPFAFNSVKFMLGGAVGDTGRIVLKSIDGVYTAVKGSQGVDQIISDVSQTSPLLPYGSYTRGQVVTLNVSEDALWNVFSLSGQCLYSGQGNQVPTMDLVSDLYVITATEGAQSRSAKLLIR